MARVVLLGQTVVGKLFGEENPVGKVVKLGPMDYRVVGILPIKGAGGFSDQDDLAVIPIMTGIKRLFGNPYLHEMAIQCASTEAIPGMMDDIRRLMRKRHRLPDFKEDDFTLRNNAEIQSTLSDTTRTFGSLLGIVAAISLFVGGVGVMNIMLVSVNERTREIRLRKAIGATRRAILIQFLLESMMLSVLGGLIGIVLALGVTLGLSAFAGWAAIVLPQFVLLAFLFSAGVGVVFGFWPAHKASLLSPIEALRYE
jgi:macrolide transport system ATP-binding/permease protein